MTDQGADYWIEHLDLVQHPEGGYFKETYRSKERINQHALPERYSSDRSFGTSIYFLLTTESVSHFHQLSSDETWHYHQGGACRIHMISADGERTSKKIGSNLEQGEFLQVHIPQNTWFAAEVIEGDYILVGCTVAPGFEFEDFLLADREELSAAYPASKTLIERFTKE